jgi:hypothetical protein
MKEGKYLFAINTPCKKDWSAMEDKDMGKFCASCNRSVIDLPQLSDQQIIDLIKKSNGKICGRLRKNQLIRKDQSVHQSLRSYSIPKLLTGLTLILNSSDISATAHKEKIEIIENQCNAHDVEIKPSKYKETFQDTTKHTIRGQVLDAHSREPLAFSNILIKEFNIETVSDFAGFFQLEIPDSLSQHQFKLVIKYVGFYDPEFEINPNIFNSSEELLIIHVEYFEMGEVIVLKKEGGGNFGRRSTISRIQL